MVEEIEVKILNIDKVDCEKILLSLGAKKVFDGEMITSAFDFTNNALKDANKILRLRKEGDKQVLGFKEMISQDTVKRMVEIEIDVSDFNKMKAILENTGFIIWAENSKYRVSYILDDVRFDFDKYMGTYSFIPEFLEIEGKNIDCILTSAKKLGFNKSDFKSWSFKDLLGEYAYLNK